MAMEADSNPQATRIVVRMMRFLRLSWRIRWRHPSTRFARAAGRATFIIRVNDRGEISEQSASSIMTVKTVCLVAALSVVAGAGSSSGQRPEAGARARTRSAIDVSRLGPQVGDLVPDFSLEDQNGRTWTRQSIMGPKGAMLVFIRSADW